MPQCQAPTLGQTRCSCGTQNVNEYGLSFCGHHEPMFISGRFTFLYSYDGEIIDYPEFPLAYQDISLSPQLFDDTAPSELVFVDPNGGEEATSVLQIPEHVNPSFTFNHDDTCDICLNPLYLQNDGIQYLSNPSCGHLFHKKCLDRWLDTPLFSSCPTCRTPIGIINQDSFGSVCVKVVQPCCEYL